MTKPTLLSLCALDNDLMEKLENSFEVIRLYKENDPEVVLNAVKDRVRGIIATMRNPVRANLIEACPNLEIISLSAVGYDNVDLEAAKANDIIVTNTPEVVTNDTADTAMGLLLNTLRRYTEGDAYVRAGQWQAGYRKPMGVTLKGKKMGIYGLGRIGKDIAKKAEVFGMQISYFGRNKQDVPYQYYDNLSIMASDVDVLMLACPGGDLTRHTVNIDVLQSLGAESYLINVARGSVVKESDLVEALKNNVIAGAGLDVFEDEPNVPDALKKMDNVVLFPHLGAATKETFYEIDALVVENLSLHFAGKPVKTPIY